VEHGVMGVGWCPKAGSRNSACFYDGIVCVCVCVCVRERERERERSACLAMSPNRAQLCCWGRSHRPEVPPTPRPVLGPRDSACLYQMHFREIRSN